MNSDRDGVWNFLAECWLSSDSDNWWDFAHENPLFVGTDWDGLVSYFKDFTVYSNAHLRPSDMSQEDYVLAVKLLFENWYDEIYYPAVLGQQADATALDSQTAGGDVQEAYYEETTLGWNQEETTLGWNQEETTPRWDLRETSYEEISWNSQAVSYEETDLGRPGGTNLSQEPYVPAEHAGAEVGPLSAVSAADATKASDLFARYSGSPDGSLPSNVGGTLAENAKTRAEEVENDIPSFGD
ncbi:hypothetical protein [Streptomyces sp. NPDC051014]|uniref:hypothetical protein n=1 Tax=Streptomyces sp. NPDC051014 TaxID=3155751 RepID=UPI0033DC0EDC